MRCSTRFEVVSNGFIQLCAKTAAVGDVDDDDGSDSYLVILDNTVTSLISHDRGGEWKTIPLEKKQCDEDKVKVGKKHHRKLQLGPLEK